MNDHIIPNLVFTGVDKAGTTSIYTYLMGHPDVGGSLIKETCYFLPPRYGAVIEPFDNYLKNFKDCVGKKFVMESSTGYYFGGKLVAKAIKEKLSNVKTIAVFREPIERFFSNFKFQKSMLELPKEMTVDQYIDKCLSMNDNELAIRENGAFFGIKGGQYSLCLDDWFEVFGDNFKVMFFEDLLADKRAFLKDICDWIGLDFEPFREMELGVENQTFDFKNKGLQKLGLTLNKMGEKIWRANPTLKSSLRSIYYKLNAKKHDDILTTEAKGILEAIYSPYNETLFRKLSQRGYDRFPQWLKIKDLSE